MATCYHDATSQERIDMASYTPTNKKMQDYRRRLRAAGLRPVQIWVPDTRSAHFAKEARRQSLLVSRHDSEKETLDFIEIVADMSPPQ
jgi:antidote-toxin recognition MazE-like antitoxin